jgi:hypothetical protein
MDFVGGLPTTREGRGYLFVVVDRFNKMCILMPCKNTIIGQDATNKFFEHVWVHFRLPRSVEGKSPCGQVDRLKELDS